MSAKPKVRRFERRLHKVAVAEWVEYLMTAQVGELVDIVKDESEPIYKRITARAALETFKRGSLDGLAWFLDRAHGRPATNMVIDAQVNHTDETIKAMTSKELFQRLKTIAPSIPLGVRNDPNDTEK